MATCQLGYSPDNILCRSDDCKKCGWNSAVEAARKKIIRKYGLTALAKKETKAHE